MDFEKLLHVARKNELSKKEQPVKCLQTKFKPPTKQQREQRMLSEGVQKFLARKEEEDKKKMKEAERRKAELLALRARDPKANKRIQTMLKRTKSANKSVMEDAIDNNNTADTLAGPSQPDEDDYGFVSETSSLLYNKLIQKMYSTPSDDLPKFAPSKKPNSSNLMNTKERVKMALLKQEEDEKLPHKRKRKNKERGKEGEEDGVELDYSAPDRDLSTGVIEREKPEKPKVRKPMPPPVDFHQLLKIAEKKQHEPIAIEPKVKKPQEPEVLMTKKQKLEYEKHQEWKKQRELRLQSIENGTRSSSKPEEKKPMQKIPKLSQSNSEPKPTSASAPKIPKINSNSSSSQESKGNSSKSSPKGEEKIRDSSKSKTVPERKKYEDSSTERLMKERDDALRILKEKEQLIREREEAMRILKEKERLIKERDEAVRKLKEKEQLIRERDEAVRKLKLLEKTEKMSRSPKAEVKASDLKSRVEKPQRPTQPISKPLPASKPEASRPEASRPEASRPEASRPEASRPEASRPEASRPEASKPEASKPVPGKAPARPGVKEFPPRDVQRSRQFPPGDVRRKALAAKRRRIPDDDDEYDSELDDFIDDGDGDLGGEDVSKVISEIFRYDKHKYSRYDEDDECMESNYAQISKEEFFSAKCGLLEDLQDIQKEKAMLARKKKR